MKKKRTNRQKLESKLDILWSKLVKQNAGYKCEYCGDDVSTLNSHHVIGRGNKNLKWDLNNGVCVCYRHHKYNEFSFHTSKTFMNDWIRSVRGDDWWDDLQEKKRSSDKMSLIRMEEIYFELKEKLNV